MMQPLGERIDEEECHAVKQINADQTEREKTVSVLFEEMDGVWLNMQDEHHKKMKKHELFFCQRCRGEEGFYYQREVTHIGFMALGIDGIFYNKYKREADNM